MKKVPSSVVKDFEEDMLLEIFKSTLDYTMKSDREYLDYLRTKIEFLEARLKAKEYDEPWKLLKKKHKAWEEDVDAKFKDLCDAYENFGKEFYDQINFYNKLKGKDPVKFDDDDEENEDTKKEPNN